MIRFCFTFTDKNYVNVNLRPRISHTVVREIWYWLLMETHHWLTRGVSTTYMALLGWKRGFGDDYFLLEWLYGKLPSNFIALSGGWKKGESLRWTLKPVSFKLFIQKVLGALRAPRNQIGEKSFKTVIKKLLEKYRLKCNHSKFLLQMEAGEWITDLATVLNRNG